MCHKGQRSRFQNKFFATYTLYREESVHTLARKHANLNLSAWSLLLLLPMQIKMKNNVNPYRSLQVMHIRHLLNKSDKKEQLHRVLHSDNLNQRISNTFYRPLELRSTLPEFYNPQQIKCSSQASKIISTGRSGEHSSFNDKIKSGARFIPSRRLPIPKARGPYRK